MERLLLEWADDFEAAAGMMPTRLQASVLMTRAQECRDAARAQNGQGAEVVAYLMTHPRRPPVAVTASSSYPESRESDAILGWSYTPLYTQPQPAVPEGWRDALPARASYPEDVKSAGEDMWVNGWNSYRIEAIQALSQISTPTTPQADGWVRVPEGWAVVPIKPTKEMKAVCRVAGKTQVWDDMMAARPEVPSE